MNAKSNMAARVLSIAQAWLVITCLFSTLGVFSDIHCTCVLSAASHHGKVFSAASKLT